jgi:hypothetical protein
MDLLKNKTRKRRKVMKRRRLRRLIAIAATFALTMSMLGAAVPEREETCRISEIQDIITGLTAARRATETIDFSQRENLHEHRYNDSLVTDNRFALLREFVGLLDEAERIQSGRTDGYYTIINRLRMPQGDLATFGIGFTHERYFAFIDYISEFTGIPRKMIEAEVAPEMSYGFSNNNPIAPPVTTNDNTLMNTAISFSMGIPIEIRWRIGSIPLRAPATLGHPTNAAGTMAFTTNHGIIPVGATIHLTTTGLQIGEVVSRMFNPANGVDVSKIRMGALFFVSNQVLNTNLRVTNFFGALPFKLSKSPTPVPPLTGRNLIMPSGRGNVNATTAFLVDERVEGTWFINVIGVNGDFRGGDSGNVLIDATNTSSVAAVGTLFAAAERQSALFSRATMYQNV